MRVEGKGFRVLRVEDLTAEGLEFEYLGSGTPTHGPGFEVLMFFLLIFVLGKFPGIEVLWFSWFRV